jgi:glycosyltransferase involved in cell wall biosynthesis
MDARKIADFGIGTYVRNLVERFSRMHGGNHFYLVLPPGETGFLPLHGPFTRCVSDSGKYSLEEHWDIPRIQRRVKADLYHSPHYVTPVFQKAPMVVTVHDLIHLIFPQYLPSKAAYVYARMMFFNTVKRAERIITDSEWSKNDLMRLLNVPGKKIRVVHLAADERFGPMPESHWRPVLKGVMGIEDSYVLFVGNFKPHKNVGGLIDAFRSVPETLCRHLVLAGKGWDRAVDLQQRAADGNMSRRILVKENLAFGELNALYCGADMLVLPSYYEGFGLPPLEAMACGVPVAVSNAASLPEVCGDAALYFHPGRTAEMAEAMLQLLKNPFLKASCIRKGRERLKQFSWEKTAEETMNVYREAV